MCVGVCEKKLLLAGPRSISRAPYTGIKNEIDAAVAVAVAVAAVVAFVSVRVCVFYNSTLGGVWSVGICFAKQPQFSCCRSERSAVGSRPTPERFKMLMVRLCECECDRVCVCREQALKKE